MYGKVTGVDRFLDFKWTRKWRSNQVAKWQNLPDFAGLSHPRLDQSDQKEDYQTPRELAEATTADR